MIVLEAGNKNKIQKVAGWFVAALLLFCFPVQATLPVDVVSALQETYSKLTFDQLLGEYNGVIEYHDELRARIENEMPYSSKKITLISQDDAWCTQRQLAWEIATKEEDKEELSRIIILEYLRCGEMQKLLEGSSE